MATKDKAAAPAEPTKEPGTAVVTWKERMQAVVARTAAMETPKNGFLSFKNGRISYDDTPVPGDKLDVIIVDFFLENTYYATKYVQGSTRSPECYAIGRVEEELKPHEECESPQGGDDGGCSDCPHNEWGSDPEGGRGKACKNTRRIAMIPADVLKVGDAEAVVAAIKKSQVVMCKLPVTSIKVFSKTVNQIVKVLQAPVFSVTVELSVTPSDNMFTVNWKILEGITDEAILQALYDKSVAAEKLLLQPYPKNEAPAAPATRSNKY